MDSSFSMPGRLMRWAMHAVGFVILFGNIAVIFHPNRIGLDGHQGIRDHLPPKVAFALHDAFLLTGMFFGYATYNADPLLMGRLADSEDLPEDERWVLLKRKEYFPRNLGTEYTRIRASHHRNMKGKRAQREAWKVLALKVRNRHNRLHPERPVDAVSFGALSWPASPEGYWVGKKSKKARYKVWFKDGSAAGNR